mmetsp:Transcript_5502/g.13161  ORF Transcript_5502/g.13161 Transcript_5502/m.13161 type:complete len:266 (-) Transcript_5502:424-1221(-)
MRMHEGAARRVQAHGLQQHLVAVGGAVEGAGAGTVIRGGLALEQLVAADLALRIELAHLGLVAVGDARAHRPCRHEDAGQMAKMQGADQQARHDLVADAQQQGRIEDIVGQCDGRAHGDGVAREQAQLHAGQSLRHAVAHGRHAASHLHGRTQALRLGTDLAGIALVGLMRRQHVVVGGDDAEVGRFLGHDAQLVAGRQGRHRMGHIGAAHAFEATLAAAHLGDAREVVAAQLGAALADAVGNLDQGGMHSGSPERPACNQPPSN